MNMNFTRFQVPVLGDGTQELYTKLYGEAGDQFMDILNSSPDEIAVISRLAAYLKNKGREGQHGYTENSKRNRAV